MIFLKLNKKLYEFRCPSYYSPMIILDMRSQTIVCDPVNVLTLVLVRPRINIDLISSVSRFYFDDALIASGKTGQIYSSYSKIYNVNDPASDADDTHNPCILLFKGKQLVQILLYIPYHTNQHFLKDIRFIHHGRRVGCCPICTDSDTELINLHNNTFYHEVCRSCLFRLETCPLCRQSFQVVDQYMQ